MTYPENRLNYIVYRKSPKNSNPAILEVEAMSGLLTARDAELWRSLVTLNPNDPPEGKSSESVGLFKGPDDDYILARACHPDEDQQQVIHQYMLISRQALQSMSGNLHQLMELTTHPLRQLNGNASLSIEESGLEDTDALQPIDMPQMPTWIASKRIEVFQRLTDAYNIPMPVLFRLLDAALSPERLLIFNYSPDLSRRIDLAEGLMMLLPPTVRNELTFATHVNQPQLAKSRIIFSDNTEETNRHIIDTSDVPDGDFDEAQSPYVAMLSHFWQGNLRPFIDELRTLEMVAGRVLPQQSTISGLTPLTHIYQLDSAITSGADVSMPDVIEALSGDNAPTGELLQQYIRRLLNHALLERESEAVNLVIAYMDAHDEIEQIVLDELTAALDDSPDDVYFFVRIRLSTTFDEQMIPILHQSARAALDVALEDNEEETLMTWLKLIAREPSEYKLSDILHEGIASARQKAHENGTLGRELVLFVAKRAPQTIDTLLDDDALMAQMDDPLGSALREYDLEAVHQVFETGREISLVLMSRAANEAADNKQAAKVFTTEAIEYLWIYHSKGKSSQLPPGYQPDHILNVLIDASDTWLAEDAVSSLMNRIISEANTDLLQQITAQIAETYDLVDMLVLAFQNNATAANKVLSLVEERLSDGSLTAQQVVNIYLQLAANRDWTEGTRPLVEQVSRSIQQDQSLTVSLDSLWQMLRIASGDTKLEAVANVVTRRALKYIEAVEDDTEFVEMLVRLHHRLEWSKGLRTYLLSWWRDFVKEQSLARIQHLDRIFDTKKEMVEEHSILETTLAIRRMLGTRSLDAFAADVNNAYNLLQALSEAFDPATRPNTHFDQQTVRTELDNHNGEISPDERRVLAKNLKELAQLIVEMSDHRSKPAIMRREEDVERQLIAGDQEPQSAIDTMRWLSGYMNGTQLDNEPEA